MWHGPLYVAWQHGGTLMQTCCMSWQINLSKLPWTRRRRRKVKCCNQFTIFALLLAISAIKNTLTGLIAKNCKLFSRFRIEYFHKNGKLQDALIGGLKPCLFSVRVGARVTFITQEGAELNVCSICSSVYDECRTNGFQTHPICAER